MGRGGRNVRAKKVFKAIAKSIGGPIPDKIIPPPAWFTALESIPPSEVLTRPIAIRHSGPPLRTDNMYKPTRLVYPEDKLRKEFYKDHPWELARPRTLVELNGKDARYLDWSKGLRQRAMPLSGESVVQRQMWLMENQKMSKQKAYDQARKEFYALRQEEDVGRRVAIEEARYVGAYFGKNDLQVSMELEDKIYDEWRGWAQEEMVKQELRRNEAYTSFGEPEAALDAETQAQLS